MHLATMASISPGWTDINISFPSSIRYYFHLDLACAGPQSSHDVERKGVSRSKLICTLTGVQVRDTWIFYSGKKQELLITRFSTGALPIGAISVLVRNRVHVSLTLCTISSYIVYGFQLRYRVLQNGLIVERFFIQSFAVLEAKVNL